MKEQIKDVRIKIDGLSQLVKGVKTIQVDLALKTKTETIDDFLQRCKIEKLGVEIINQSKELEKAYDSLILGKAWLGKVLGELGTENPYKSGYKTKEDIEPVADKPSINSESFIIWLHEDFIQGKLYDKNHIEKVDWLRTEIEGIIEEVKNLVNIDSSFKTSREFAIARTNSYNHLSEARFWLGWELERIKNN